MAHQNIDIQDIITLVHKAGAEIMARRGKTKTIIKPDGSPVTDADIAAHDILKSGLTLYNIPVISEENDKAENEAIVQQHDTYWITDPLDGTRSFLSNRDGFGVHLGLVVDGEPVLGVAYFPSLNVTYFTGNDGKAYMLDTETNNTTEIQVNKETSSPDLTVAASWRVKDQPSDINGTKCSIIPGVGGQRLCLAAQGVTDIGLIDRAFSWWDVAAAHAILKAAGGDMFDIKTNAPVRYNDKKLYIDPAIGGVEKIVNALHKGTEPKPQKLSKKRPGL